MAKRITQTIQRDIVDLTTGEIITVDSQKTFTEKVNPEKFYMTFIDYVAPIYQLHSEVARRMLDWMCEHAAFNTGIVDLSTSKRQQMCTELNLANNQVTNNLKKLKDLDLISGEKGTFKINPEIFWKGELSVRKKELLENKDLKVSFELIDRP
jgi:predicted transcriptional regulator